MYLPCMPVEKVKVVMGIAMGNARLDVGEMMVA
jgi:hypothetical protein